MHAAICTVMSLQVRGWASVTAADGRMPRHPHSRLQPSHVLINDDRLAREAEADHVLHLDQGGQELRVVVDGDAVVIVDEEELARANVARVGAGLVGDALLGAAITHDAVGAVVGEGDARAVVQRRQ